MFLRVLRVSVVNPQCFFLASPSARLYRWRHGQHVLFRADALGGDVVARLVWFGVAAACHALFLRLVSEYRLAHSQPGLARDRARALGLSPRALLGRLCRARRIHRRAGARARPLHPARWSVDLPLFCRRGLRSPALRWLFLEPARHGISGALGSRRALFRMRRRRRALARSPSVRRSLIRGAREAITALAAAKRPRVNGATVSFNQLIFGARRYRATLIAC